jgi:hypothetical protein
MIQPNADFGRLWLVTGAEFLYNGRSSAKHRASSRQECLVKKGRHRRYEEARALKQTVHNDDIESLFDRLDDDPFDLPVTDEAALVGDDED